MDYLSLLDQYQIFKDVPSAKAIVVIVMYVILAFGINLFIDKILKRLASHTKLTIDDKLIKHTHGPIFWTVVFLGVLHGLLFLDLKPPLNTICPGIIHTLMLLVWWMALFRIISFLGDHIFQALEKRGKMGRDIYLLLLNLTRFSLIILGIFWAFSIWNVNLTPLFASAGIAGIAVALAAKDTLANFFGGISVFMDRAYKVGDYIVLDSGERGEVVDIGIRSTRIKTRDDVLITIPNSIMAAVKISNESAPVPSFRIRAPVGVAYGSDLDHVENILMEVAKSNTLLAIEPEPRVRVRAFADSSINFELLCWVKDPSNKGLALHQLFMQIDKTFKREGIVIPFPQRDIHLNVDSDQNPLVGKS